MRKKTFLKIVELQTEQSKTHLDEVRSIHKELRGYKHDFHNHLQTLKGYIENPLLKEYDYSLKGILTQKAHILSESEEKLLALASEPFSFVLLSVIFP